MPDYYYLFPFAQVKKGSRILIYGAGRVGENYWAQIKESGYCRVKGFLDPDPVRFRPGMEDALIYPPDKLSTIEEEEYDAVVVAYYTGRLIDEACEVLCGYGVKQGKIVAARGQSRLPADAPAAGRTLKVFLDNVREAKEEIRQYLILSRGDFDYFSPLAREAAREREEKGREELLARFDRILEAGLTTVERIVVLKLMYDAELFDGRYLKQLAEEIKKLDEPNEKYWLTLEWADMPFFYPSYRYDEFYLDKRELFKEIMEDFSLQIKPSDEEANPGHIVVAVTHLVFRDTSPTNLICAIANELSRLGYKVTILCAEAILDNSSSTFLHPRLAIKLSSRLYHPRIADLLDPDIEVRYAEGDTLKERIVGFLRQLVEENPSAILDITDEYCPASYVYSQHYRTVYIPMRENYSGSYFRRLVSGNKEECLRKNEIYRCLAEEQILDLPFPFTRQPEKSRFRRKDHGLDDADFVYVTVGTRLFFDLTPEFIDSVCALLRHSPRLKWIIVGERLSGYLLEAAAGLAESGQILLWGFEEDLTGLYGICDAYLNPDRVGGGLSITGAMQCGLPVASTGRAHASALYLPGEDLVDGGYDQLMDYALRLADDPAFCRRQSEKMKELSGKMSLCRYAQRLSAFLSAADG